MDSDFCESLYMSVHEAAEWSGVGEKWLRRRLDSIDPPPYLTVGNRRYIERDGLKDYLHERQEVIFHRRK